MKKSIFLQLRWAAFTPTLLALTVTASASDPNAYRLFAIKTDTDDLVEINRTTGEATRIFTLPFDATAATGFDYNPADESLYAVHPDGSSSVGFYKIDQNAKTATKVKSSSASSGNAFQSVGFKNDGNVYAYADPGGFTTGLLYSINLQTSASQTLGSSSTPNMLGGDYDEVRNVFWASDEWNAKVYQLSVQNSSVAWTSTSTWYTANGPWGVGDIDVAPNGDVLIAATDDGPGVSRILKMNVANKTWSTLFTISGVTDYRIATLPAPADFTLAVSVLTNGSVAGAGNYPKNATATLTATAISGYIFTGWTGDASGTTNPLAILSRQGHRR